jgi:hypothetical protein
MRPLLIAPNTLRRTPHCRPARANIYPGTEAHPERSRLRIIRRANIDRKFYTGHWQHRVIDAKPA